MRMEVGVAACVRILIMLRPEERTDRVPVGDERSVIRLRKPELPE